MHDFQKKNTHSGQMDKNLGIGCCYRVKWCTDQTSTNGNQFQIVRPSLYIFVHLSRIVIITNGISNLIVDKILDKIVDKIFSLVFVQFGVLLLGGAYSLEQTLASRGEP